MEALFKHRYGNISFSDQGKGKAIILIHGYLETSAVWSSFAASLADEFRVIAVDLPGHGNSDLFNETNTMEFMAGLVNDLAGSLGIKRFFLTGHSMGGYVTLAFAGLYPERLLGYCLFASHPFADTPEIIEKREHDINLTKAGGKDLIWPDGILKMYALPNLEKFRDNLQRSKSIAAGIQAEAIASVLRGMIARPSTLSVMEGGKKPCLWILGRMDNYINCEQAMKKVILPANARLVVLENSGHLGFIEEEELSVEILKSFIKENT
jgi:pimeloyl-ACP methyl ester carboxylesterase